MYERSFTIDAMNRTDRNEQRVTQILQAALQCFLAKGFHQTSMRDIAQAAGVSLGNLYNHFPGKEAIILAVAVAESEELAPMLQRLAAADGERTQVMAFLQDFHALCRQPEWATLAVEVLAECAQPCRGQGLCGQPQAAAAGAGRCPAACCAARAAATRAGPGAAGAGAVGCDRKRCAASGLGEADGTEDASLDLGLLVLLLGARA